MVRTCIGSLGSAIGQQVTVKGWVQTIRDQKQMQFLVIRDHTGLAQVTVEKGRHAELAEAVSGLTRESAATFAPTIGLVSD